MPTIGLPELIVIGMILLLVFGASRLPQLGEGLGKSIGKMRRSLKEDERIEVADGGGTAAGQQSSASPAGEQSPVRPAGEADDAEDAELVDKS